MCVCALKCVECKTRSNGTQIRTGRERRTGAGNRNRSSGRWSRRRLAPNQRAERRQQRRRENTTRSRRFARVRSANGSGGGGKERRFPANDAWGWGGGWGGGKSCYSDVNRMQLDDVSPFHCQGAMLRASRVLSSQLHSSLHPSTPGTTSESGLISASDGS